MGHYLFLAVVTAAVALIFLFLARRPAVFLNMQRAITGADTRRTPSYRRTMTSVLRAVFIVVFVFFGLLCVLFIVRAATAESTRAATNQKMDKLEEGVISGKYYGTQPYSPVPAKPADKPPAP